MNKKLSEYNLPLRISSNSYLKFFFVVGLTLVILFVFIHQIMNNDLGIRDLIMLLGALSVCLYFLKVTYSMVNIRIDEENIYAKGVNLMLTIKHKDIRSIKMLPDSLNRKNIWKIEYSESKEIKSIKFLQRGWSLKYLMLFQDTALKRNKNIRIKNYTDSFDNDV